jgi:hypothetical protein
MEGYFSRQKFYEIVKTCVYTKKAIIFKKIYKINGDKKNLGEKCFFCVEGQFYKNIFFLKKPVQIIYNIQKIFFFKTRNSMKTKSVNIKRVQGSTF